MFLSGINYRWTGSDEIFLIASFDRLIIVNNSFIAIGFVKL